MAKNNLQALAIRAGLATKAKLLTKAGEEKLRGLTMGEAGGLQRQQWLALLKELDQQISRVESWLRQQAKADQRVTLLQTHPGIGWLTALGLIHTLEPVSRFRTARKVVAYVGLEPMERSSGEKQRFAGISKAGCRLLRYLVIEAAHTAVKGDAELKGFYQRLASRKGKQKAIIAAGRKLLVRGSIRLRDGIDDAEFVRRGVEARPARD